MSTKSWCASISAGLGLLSLMGVACFHFPDLLTSRDFRSAYTEEFARNLMLVGLVAAFILGTWSIMRGRQPRLAMVGVGSAALAVMFGGATVEFDPIRSTPFSLGLDWFVISLFFSALVFIPMEKMLPVRAMSPLRPEWQTDLAYFFMSHVLVQFLLIAVTSTTTTVDTLVANEGLKATIQAWPVWVQFLAAVFLADLAQAVLHNIYHRTFLWRFHAVHHSSRHMDWLAGSRIHIVEMLLTRTAVLLPLVIAGFSAPALNAYVILVGVQAVVAHSNLRLNLGWLENLIVTPRYHHWHHARHEDYMYVNYAIHLPLVDMLMGTFKPGPKGQWPEEYGVMKLETVPQGFWRQSWMPFGRKKEFDDFVGKSKQ